MISGFPSIVLIDDREDELDRIKTAFFDSGMPCLPIQYLNEPGNDSGIDHVDVSEWSSPRIVVSDLNLTEVQNAKPATLAGPLARMLGKLSLKGPYLLCVWSKLEDQVKEVIEILESRYRERITLPFQVSVISKSEFLSEPEKLKEKLKEQVSGNSLFDCLLNWESKMSDAARGTIETLYSLAQESCEDKTISGQTTELRKILAIIGNEAIGQKNASSSPGEAMEYGLNPVMEDQIRSLAGSDLNEKWRGAVPEIGQRLTVNDFIKSKLNTFFHIEEVSPDSPKCRRGTFVCLDQDFLTLDGNREKFEKRIGRSIKSLIHEEFLPNTDDALGKANRRNARSEIILGFLEVSPECDFAQRKIKLPKYILGALISEEFENFASWYPKEGILKDRAHDGIHRLPKIFYNGKRYLVKFSFKYQFGTQAEDNLWFGDSLFRVRDQILSAIIFSCAQYSSRPGIVGFF